MLTRLRRCLSCGAVFGWRVRRNVSLRPTERGETGGQRYSGESPLSDPGWGGFVDMMERYTYTGDFETLEGDVCSQG